MTSIAPLPAPAVPPRGVPAILRTIVPGGDDGLGPLPSDAEVRDGRLHIRAPVPGRVAGAPFSPDPYRDVIVDAVVSLERGADNDAYGLFVRQTEEQTYLAFLVTPGGQGSLVMVAGGASSPIAGGPLPADAPFAPGTGAPNRLTIITAGPCITCLINGFVVTGTTVDARYKAGLAGVVLARLSSGSDDPVVALSWAQVRALLPDQG